MAQSVDTGLVGQTEVDPKRWTKKQEN